MLSDEYKIGSLDELSWKTSKAMLESVAVAMLIAVSVFIPGKYCKLFLEALALVPTTVLVTLPDNWTELLNCFCSGPTSAKSLGTLFILSLNNTILAVA